jgi:hypothetical protein
MGVGNEVYSGLATFGKIQSVIGLFFLFLIVIVMILIGSFLLSSESKYKNTNSTVIDASCVQVSNTYQCDINLSYFIEGKEYITPLKLNNLNSEIQKNTYIEIEYKSDSPTTIRSPNNTLSWVGWGLIMVSIFLLIIGIVSTFLTFKFKPYAAITGAQSLIPRTPFVRFSSK